MRTFTILLGTALLFLSLAVNAQYETVVFNYDRSYFNEGRPLPAETKFMISGEVARDVQMVEVKIYEHSNTEKEPAFRTIWKRQESNTRNTFTIPVNYPLRGNDKYTLVVNYYKPVTASQQNQVMKQLEESLWAYLDQSFIVTRGNLEMRKHPKVMMDNMNTIVKEGIYFYKNRINYEFPGFSDIVREKIEQIRNLKLRKAKFNVFSKGEDDTREIKLRFAKEQIEALKILVSKEVLQYYNTRLLAVTDSKKMVNYPTEKTRNVLAVNVGYAGVYNEGGFDDFNSGNAPFAGISIPFGKASFSNPFWSKASISTGIFLTDIEFSDVNIATGPIVNKPLYLGLGYRALPFVRINAGATFLQSDQLSNNLSDLNVDKIYVRPYVGLSIEFDFWIGLNK
jgi:predicted DNA binding CopG/RHH family protein